MSIRWKLGLIFLLISLVPLILFSVVSIQQSQTIIRQEIGLGFELIAREKAIEVADVLDRRVNEAKVLALHPKLIAAVAAQNASYIGKSDEENLKEILSYDKAWIHNKGKTDRARIIHKLPVADFLREYQSHDTKEYGEIFLTDRLGGTVTMTGSLTDYYQADEGWWKEGFHEGKGSVFIDDRGADLSVNAIVTGVVVPILVDGEVGGLLKVNFKMAHIPAIISNPYKTDDVHIFMMRSNGKAVIDPTQGKHLTATNHELDIILTGRKSGLAEDRHEGMDMVMGFARVDPQHAIFSRFVPDPSKKGVSGEKWGQSNWYIFVERSLKTAYAPLEDLTLFTAFGTLVIAVVVIAFSGILSTSLTFPLVQLRQHMQTISEGNLDVSVGSERKDEIGEVLRDIDIMVERLKTTLASRDDLNHEIEERQKVAQALNERTQELEISIAEAEQASLAKTQFLSSMSHELRTPLNAVIGFSQLMQLNKSEPLSEKQKNYTDNVISGGVTLLELINGILDLAKVEAGELQFSIHDYYDRDIIQESIMLVESTAAIYDVSIENKSHKKAPTRILVDNLRLKQVLVNLLSNAAKYNKTDGHIILDKTQTDDGYLRISIVDTGMGIPLDKHDSVFTAFNRLNVEMKRSVEGTGIGLSVAKQLIEGMNGRIGFESIEHVGSTFWVDIPLASHQNSET